jgi:hypothetical protein
LRLITPKKIGQYVQLSHFSTDHKFFYVKMRYKGVYTSSLQQSQNLIEPISLGLISRKRAIDLMAQAELRRMVHSKI